MSFLAPVAFWIAAAALPALLILYFLKLRRREQVISSTLLWKRAVQDLQVNAPFQRLRKNLLLFLQMLVLIAAIVALARPMVKTDISGEKSLVILIDRSASMNSSEAGGRTRLELAKEQAVRHVKALNRTGAAWLSWFGAAPAQTQAMLIAFSDRASVVSPFTTNTADLSRLIEEIEPSDGRTDVREALQLAEAYMTQTVLEQTPESAEQSSTILLVSDGALGDLRDVAPRAGAVKLVRVGETDDNVGITALRLQRSYERPEALGVFVQARNFGAAAIETDVALYVDGRLRSVRPIKLAAAPAPAPAESDDSLARAPESALVDDRAQASSADISFDLELENAALLEARLSRPDALDADNRAYALAPAPRRLRVLLVSSGNFFLEKVFRYLPLERFDYMTPEQYESAALQLIETDGRSIYDVVIFDKHATQRLPTGGYIFFAATPQIEGVRATGAAENQAMIWWDETDPVLRYVALDYVFAAKSITFEAPREAETLVEGARGPIFSRFSKDGSQYLIVAFAVEDSTWWSQRSFPIFAYNAVSYLGGVGLAAASEPVRPGEALRFALTPGATQGTLLRPDGKRISLTPDDTGAVRYAGANRVGVYSMEGAPEDRSRIAVNLESAAEGDIRPRGEVTLGQLRLTASEGIRSATPEIWRWFVGAALAVAMIEWYIYNRRVMI